MLLFIIKFLLIFNVQAGLVSSMPSTYLPTGIPNSHLVSKNTIRGMAPRNSIDVDVLLSLGVTDFLIFKIDTAGEVQKEINLLEGKGVAKNHITHIDFPWKDITDFRPICEMTVDALITLESAERANRKIFFHCTVGEDRTGYLAGLYRIYRDNKSIDDVFVNELCDKGYEAGNPKKGMNVVFKVRETLTPAFLTMADLINKAKANKQALSKKLCTSKEFNSYSAGYLKLYTCQKSSLLH